MDLIKKECIASVTLFDLRASEGELMLLEGCIDCVVKNCSDEMIEYLTGCKNKEELSAFRDDVFNIVKNIEHKEYLLARYKKIVPD